MNDTTMDQTAAPAETSSEISKLAEVVARLESGLSTFSSAALQILTGQQTEQKAAPAKRRGRPPKARAAEAPAKEEKPLHPLEIQISDIVFRAGRITQADLATKLSADPAKPMPPSQVEHHVAKLMKRGQIRCEKVVPPEGHPHLVYYRSDWFSTRTGGK